MDNKEEKAMDVEAIENIVVLGRELHQKQIIDNGITHQENPTKPNVTKWWLILLNCILALIGYTSGPILIRLYYLHGGSRKWMASWLQTVGCPIFLVPITVLYFCGGNSSVNLAPLKLVPYGAAVGLIAGLTSLTYSYGLSYVPVSTIALLLSTNLAFTAFFAFIMVNQKFTPYTINSIVLMVSGAVLLGIRKNSDRTPGVTNSQYLLGFLLTLFTAGLTGLMLPCCEFGYARAGKNITYSVVLQFSFIVNVVATLFSTIGMLINKDFAAIPREASEFELGVTKYYVLLVSSAVVWPIFLLGSFGLVFCTSSLASGVFGALMLPIQEIASMIVFHEKFNGEKGMSLVLCLWGFTSYFYGYYKENKKQKQKSREIKL